MTKTVKKTKERLVETAMELIWESSYGSVSVDDICKKAAINKGSFYHHFPSKIDLAIAAMDAAFNEFRPIMDEIFSPTVPPIERFEKYTKMGYETQKEIAEEHGMVCGCPFISLGSEMAPQDESIRAKTDEIIGYHQKYYESTIRDLIDEGLLPKDTDAKAKAAKIYAFVMGQLVMARIQNSLEPMQRDLKTGLFRMLGLEHKLLENA